MYEGRLNASLYFSTSFDTKLTNNIILVAIKKKGSYIFWKIRKD